jgi:long-chain acyl-CoA synthetase
MARPAVLTVADTIARSFLLAVETRGEAAAIREKKFGIWQPTSWRQWLQISKDIAYALRAIGFLPGDVASIIANAVPEWVFADIGILCAGGVSSGIYPTDSTAQVEYLINDSRTKVIFAEDEEQLDKVLSCRARCPTLQRIVVFDMEGLSGFSDPMVMSLAEFTALGRNHIAGNEALWDEMIESRKADDLAILVYTSGTTGPPKGAMHSNRGVTHQMRHAGDLFPSTDSEERLVFLPLCHVAERVGGYYNSLAVGSVMNFAESPETVPDNLREVQPTAFLAVPRIWEKFYSGVTIALKDGARSLPDCAHGCRSDRAGTDPLVSRARHRHARGLRADRKLRRRDADAEGSHQARFGRDRRAVGRGDDLPARRDPDQGRLPVHGLFEPAGKDRGDHRRQGLAAHRRCRRHRQ